MLTYMALGFTLASFSSLGAALLFGADPEGRGSNQSLLLGLGGGLGLLASFIMWAVVVAEKVF